MIQLNIHPDGIVNTIQTRANGKRNICFWWRCGVSGRHTFRAIQYPRLINVLVAYGVFTNIQDGAHDILVYNFIACGQNWVIRCCITAGAIFQLSRSKLHVVVHMSVLIANVTSKWFSYNRSIRFWHRQSLSLKHCVVCCVVTAFRF